MPSYYLDIETTGLEPSENEIITIQYAELERNTGKRIGDINILKSWESSEKEILTEFVDSVNLHDSYPFNFIPVGYNLGFEHKFLSYRSEVHKTFPVEIIPRPHIDLHQLAILLKQGEFKGTKLNDMTNKPSDGSKVPIWYRNKEYENIEKYIQDEADEFIKFVEWAFRQVPTLAKSLENHMN